MKTLTDLIANYKMGFITSAEFINKYMRLLCLLGSPQDLMDAENALLAPLADYLVNISEGSGNLISGFSFKLEVKDPITKEVTHIVSFN